jgi:hypothetical protein
MGNKEKDRMPPSLTTRELRDIQRACRANPSPVVIRLLWEVSRLRTVAMHADHFEQITRGCNDVTAGVVGDFLRERLNELAVVRERRYKPLIGAMPDREKKSIGERAHEAERLATNSLTPEELEDLTQQLTGRVLSDLSSWLGRSNSPETDAHTIAGIHRHFIYLPQAIAEGVMPAVVDRVAAHLRAQLKLLTRIAI